MTDMTDFVIISLSAVFCALLVAVTSLMLRRAFPDGVLTDGIGGRLATTRTETPPTSKKLRG